MLVPESTCSTSPDSHESAPNHQIDLGTWFLIERTFSNSNEGVLIWVVYNTFKRGRPSGHLSPRPKNRETSLEILCPGPEHRIRMGSRDWVPHLPLLDGVGPDCLPLGKHKTDGGRRPSRPGQLLHHPPPPLARSLADCVIQPPSWRPTKSRDPAARATLRTSGAGAAWRLTGVPASGWRPARRTDS